MAKVPPAAAATAASAGAKPRKSGKLRTMTFILGLLFAAPLIMPTITLVLLGLIPTYVAFMTDSDRQKSGAISVGAMNIAGLTPFVIDLWTKGQTMPNAFAILGDSHSMLIILGASFVGQMIVYAIPQAIASLTLTHAETRVKSLRKNLDLLKESWGPDVASSKPLDQVNQD
jgi:hypothetical protein